MGRKPVLSEHCHHRFSQSKGGDPAELVRASAGRPLAPGALAGFRPPPQGRGATASPWLALVLCGPVVNMAPLTPQQPSQTQSKRGGGPKGEEGSRHPQPSR